MSEVQSTTQLSAAAIDQVAGGADCGTSVSIGTDGANLQHNDVSPYAALVAVYEGFVGVTSHIIGRIAGES